MNDEGTAVQEIHEAKGDSGYRHHDLGASDHGGEISEPPGGGQIHGRRYAWESIPDIPRR